MKSLKTIINENEEELYNKKIAIGEFGPILYYIDFKDLTDKQLRRRFNVLDYVIEDGDLCFNLPIWLKIL